MQLSSSNSQTQAKEFKLPVIGFIGAGNMANSLIRGMIATGAEKTSILAADLDSAKLSTLKSECAIETASSAEIAKTTDIIVLAVKAQVMKIVYAESDVIGRDMCVVRTRIGHRYGYRSTGQWSSLFMESMQKSAQEMGLTEDVARTLIYKTALGAAELVIAIDESTERLRLNATSSGGTTEQAIKQFQLGNSQKLVDTALKLTQARSIELAAQFDEKS
jgi:pyrroline-5-carboxylate reductase